MDTCLSPMVHHIICEVGISAEAPLTKSINAKGLLNWSIIKDILPDPVVPEEEDPSYFVSCVEQLSPVFSAIHQHYHHLGLEEFRTQCMPYLKWTTSSEVLEHCYETNREDSANGPLESLLLLTPILERSLGNVYLIKGKQCPPLQKDLLLTEILKSELGETPIHVLRILIGPPISLNIRNVLWHGFPAASEIHQQYTNVLLCLMVNIGQILLDKGLTKYLKKRRCINLSPITLLREGLPEVPDELSDIEELFNHSIFIQTSLVPLWLRAFTCYNKRMYGECISLLLPQLEHGIRRLFAKANNCQNRILTAESTVLFTTFDEMLHPEMEDGSQNKLRQHIGDNVLMYLLDILVYPDGPRIRDRVSHGEINIRNLTKDIVDSVVCICLELALQTCDQMHRNDEFLKQLEVFFCEYQSVYHPVNKIRKHIYQTANNLMEWAITPEYKENSNTSFIICDMTDILKGCSTKYDGLPWTLDVRIIDTENNVTRIAEEILKNRLHTLYRQQHLQMLKKGYQRDEEILGLLGQLSLLCSQVSAQVQAVLTEKSQQFERKELRSRQRKTYDRMLQSLPILSAGLRLVLSLVVSFLYVLEYHSPADDKEETTIVRVLKLLLKYCENVYTYSNADKNRWDEATALTTDIVHKLKLMISV